MAASNAMIKTIGNSWIIAPVLPKISLNFLAIILSRFGELARIVVILANSMLPAIRSNPLEVFIIHSSAFISLLEKI